MNQGNIHMSLPKISEEPEVPSEGSISRIHGSTATSGITTSVYENEVTMATGTHTPNPGLPSTAFSTIERPILETGTHIGLPSTNFGYVERPLGSAPIQQLVATDPMPQSVPYTGVTHVNLSGVGLNPTAPITAKDQKQIEKHLGPNADVGLYDVAAPITAKDERQVEQHLGKNADVGLYDVTKPVTDRDRIATNQHYPYSQVTGSNIIQNPVVGSTTLHGQETITTSTVHQTPVVGSTTLHGQETLTTSTVHQTVPTVVESTFIEKSIQSQSVQPQFIPTNISGIEYDSQHLRDSGIMRSGVNNELHQSRWDAQQSQTSSMRYESHQTFENWETNRNIFVNDRLNIITDLLAGMDRTLDWLDVGVDKVILFFREREAQELEFSKRIKHGLTQVGEHFERGDHPEILENFSRGMKENDAFHSMEKRNSEVMGMFIKKDILDWILLPAQKTYKEQAIALKTPLHTYKKKMDHLASKRQRAYHKYFKLYDSILKNNKPTTKEDSLFKRQLKYSLAAREELRMLRLYDEQSLMVIGEFAKLNSQRMAEVRRAYTLYLQKYAELNQHNVTTPEPILDLIQRSAGTEAVPQLFSVRNLLSPNNYEFMRRTLNAPGDLTFQDLDPFLVNFPESIDPSRTSFVLKEWEAVKQGNLLKKQKACSVIATSNNNLLIVEKKHEEREIGRVREPLQLRFTKVEEVNATDDGTVLKVVERAPGTLFTHTTRTKLKFETSEEAQQFMTYVNSQTSGDV